MTDLFDGTHNCTDEPDFDGSTYDPAQDKDRLNGQLGRVHAALKPGAWLTLADLAAASGGSEASASARLRDLRKPKFGGHTIERRRVAGASGLWEYRMVAG